MNTLMKNEGKSRGGQRGPQKTTEQRRELGLRVQAGRAQGRSFKQLREILNESYIMLRSCFDQVVAEQATELASHTNTINTISATLGVNGTTSLDRIQPSKRVEVPSITPYIRLNSPPAPTAALMPELKVVQEKSRREQLMDAAIAHPDKAEIYYDMIKMLDKR
jgi:hypothetical protein